MSRSWIVDANGNSSHAATKLTCLIANASVTCDTTPISIREFNISTVDKFLAAARVNKQKISKFVIRDATLYIKLLNNLKKR